MHAITPSKLLRRLGLAIATLITTASLALAQPSSTGTIQGRVLNVSNGSYLNNARVTVEGTQLQTFTNGYGEYRLDGVPAGTAKLHVFYTGQAEQVLSVDVPAGQTVTEDVNLGAPAAATPGGEVVKLDQFVVASQKDTDQKSIAINEQRFSPILKSVVSTDQFGDVTEGNVGEFLKYMPGISLEYTSPDARQIIIRGINPIYTAVFVDGNRMASAASSGSNRFFELEQASINSASRIEVTFSRTPEQDADALGGAVNMISKSAFEVARPKLDFRADVSFNGDDLKLGKTPGPFNEPERKWHPSFDLSYLNPVSKRFGFTINVAESDIYYPQHRSQPTWSFPLASGSTTVVNPFLKSYQMQDGPKDNKRQNLSSKLDFKISDTDSFSITPQWNYYDAPFANRNLTWNVLPTTKTPAPTANGPTFVQSAPAAGTVSWGSSFRHKYGTTYQIDSHYIHRGPEWTFEGSGSISHATNHYHDYQDGHFENAGLVLKNVTVRMDGMNLHDYTRPDTITVTDANGNPINSYANLGAYTINNGNFNEADSTDLFRSARVSAAHDVNPFNIATTVKVGATIQDHRRDIQKPNVSYSFIGPDGKAGTADDLASNYDIVDSSYSTVPTPWGLPQVTYPSPYKLYDLFLAHPEYWSTNPTTNLTNKAKNSQYIDEYITAAYIQGDSRMLNNRFRAVYGVRFERTDDYAQGYKQDPTIGTVAGAYHERALKAKNHYAGAYPSLATTYNVTDNLIARASYTRALGRPDFGNIIPGASLPDPQATQSIISINNTTLSPEQADNYDFGLDYYFSHVGSLGVSIYRKDIANFYGSSSIPATVELLNALGIPDADTYVNIDHAQVKSNFNSGTARITGVQLDYKQQLTWVPLPQNQNLGVFATGYSTHLMGAPNADFSNYISKSLNTGLDYHTPWFSVKFNMNYRGQQRYTLLTLDGLQGAYTYFKPRTQFDTTIDFPINRHFSAFINGRNIFNKAQDQEIYGWNSPGYTRLSRREEFGAQWWAGIRGRF